jgi:hypothetical protein
MTDALKMFEGVKYELDQVQSAEFDISDFNYFINKAIENRVKSELDQFELTQKVSDKIAPLVKSDTLNFNADSTTDVRKAALPDDYRHVVSSLVKLRYKAATTVYAVSAERSKHSKRITGDNWSFTMDNYYMRPLISDSDIDLYHRVIGSELNVLIDTPEYPETKAFIASVELEYIKKIPVVEISEDEEIVVDTVFPPHFNQEIVTECAKLFLENEANQRAASIVAVNQ